MATKSLVNSRLAANSQAPKLPKTHSPGDTGKGDRSVSRHSSSRQQLESGSPLTQELHSGAC